MTRKLKPSVLTPKQKEVLAFIHDFTKRKGYAPSQKEIAENFQFSSLGTVQNYLKRLRENGLLDSHGWNSRRGLEVSSSGIEDIIQKQRSDFSLPVLGKVAAGKPIDIPQGWEVVRGDYDQVFVPEEVLSFGQRKKSFVLKVQGQSMIDEGIFEEDWVVIEKTNEARSGQTVVAVFNDAATIKKYFQFSNRVELHSANAMRESQYRPMIFSHQELIEKGFRIEGILRGVIRKYS